MESKTLSPTKRIKIVIGCTITVLLITSFYSILGLLAGSIELSNTLLPANIFSYTGWMRSVFGAFGVVGFVFGIIFAFHGVTSTDVESYEVSGGRVTKTSDGCMAQIMGVLLMPFLMAALAYAASYYLFWGVLEIGVFLLPYLIGLLLVSGILLYGIMGWRRRAKMSMLIHCVLAGVLIVIYGGLSFFFAPEATFPDGQKVFEDISSTFETSDTELTAQSLMMTETGVGSLVLGKPFQDMSASNEGLYNKVKEGSYHEVSSDCTIYTYTLYWDETEVASFELVEKGSPIDRLTVTSPKVSLANGIKIGMPLQEALKKEGVEGYACPDALGETECGYTAGMSYGQIGLVSPFYGGCGILSDTGSKKAKGLSEMDDCIDLKINDFKSEARVTCFYISLR